MTRNSSIFRKIIAAMTTVLLTATFMLPATSVSAAGTETTANVVSNDKVYQSNKQLCDRIAEGIDQMEEYIYVGDLNVDIAKLPVIFKTVLRRNPELFYINTRQFGLGGDEMGNIEVVCPIYTGSKEEIQVQRNLLTERAYEIIMSLNDNMTDLEKALVIHDEIALGCEYKTDENNDDYVTPYSSLVNGLANCQGYSSAYSYLLSLAGIKSEIVESSALFHVWNNVQIGGEWYNVDVTWDDPLNDKPGYVDHKYFLLSDKAIQRVDSTKSNEFGTDYQVNACTSTKYDNYSFHNINTRFCYVDNNFYVIDNAYGSATQKSLLKFDPNTDTKKVVETFDYRWKSSTSATSYWKDTYMTLDESDGLMYFNTPDAIFTYDAATKKVNEFNIEDSFKAEIPSGKSFYSVVIKGGKVCVGTTDNPNNVFTLTPVGYCSARPIAVGVRKAMTTYRMRGTISVMFGDINGDETISVNDATDIQKISAETAQYDDVQLMAADVNDDGVVNIVDCTLVQRYIAEI